MSNSQNNRTALTANNSFETSQTVFVSDIISEGPIEGLVDGPASVFLDNVRIMPVNQAAQRLFFGDAMESAATVTFTSGSTVTYTGDPIPEPNYGTRFLIVQNITTVENVQISSVTSEFGKVLTLSLDGFDFSPYKSGYGNTTFTIPAVIRLSDGDLYEFFITDASTIGRATGFSSGGPGFESGTYDIMMGVQVPISSYSPGSLTLAYDTGITGGPFAFNYTSGIGTEGLGNAPSNQANFKDVSVQFRVGQLDQAPLEEIGGVGNLAYSTTANLQLLQVSQQEGRHNFEVPNAASTGSPVEIALSSQFAGILPSGQIPEVDELRLLINYQALGRSWYEGGTLDNYAFYRVELAVTRGSVQEEFITLDEQLTHSAATTSPITFELTVNLEEFKPFDDVTLRISRLTTSENGYPGTLADGTVARSGKSTGFSSAAVGSIVAILKEKFTYPYTAYSGITFSSKDFQNFPRRTYECRGLKVKVPDNYVTREESSDGVAKYTRNTSTGTVESTPQDWTGGFRQEKVYTNNPAWVFYDIVTSNRYGIGQWVDAEEINIFELYRIGKYCDELVPDGKGGLEPRFTANIYLTKATDAYKVLKDFATIFRGILFWMDSQLVPIMDAPRMPVASFSCSNVVDGLFTYTGTGSKARPNQIIVSWNNPEQNYELQPIIVEDNQNIIDTGRVITEKAVAFGCTSEGQATRYGRWKLWTAKNQTELVSFQASLNANFVTPGDVILVSDSNRYIKSKTNDGSYQPTRWSGRISRNVTPTDVLVPLDRNIELATGYTYSISTFIPTASAYLAQPSATILGVDYSEGDLLPNALYADELAASNLVDDDNQPVQTNWSEFSRIETRPITNPVGNVIDTVTISASNPFSLAPESDTIWVLNAVQDDSNLEVVASGKEYRVLSVVEDAKNLYEITAVEHFNEKFQDIELNFSLAVDDTVLPPEDIGGVVPPPSSVVALNLEDPKKRGNEVRLQWKPPKNVNNLGEFTNQVYEYLDGYEISHNIPGYESPITVPAQVTSFEFVGVIDGVYTLGVRTLSQKGNKSIYRLVDIDVLDPYSESITRILGIAKGAFVSSRVLASADQQSVAFNSKTYSIRAIQQDSGIAISNGSNPLHVNQDIGGFNNVQSSQGDNLNQTLNSAFLYYEPAKLDSSQSSDPYSLIGIDADTFPDTPYWYRMGDGSLVPTDTEVALTGIVDVQLDSNELVGTATLFTEELEVGQVLKFNNGGSFFGAKVSRISSDTQAYVSKIFDITATYSAGEVLKTGFSPNYRTDCLLGRVFYDGANRQFDSYIILDSSIAFEQLGITATANISSLFYDNNQSLVTDYDNITLTISSSGYSNPEYFVEGSAFSVVSVGSAPSGPDAGFQSGLGQTFTKLVNDSADIPYSPNDLQFTITVREGDFPDDEDLYRTATVSITRITNDPNVETKTASRIVYYQTLLSPGSAFPPGVPDPVFLDYNFDTREIFIDNDDIWSGNVPNIPTGQDNPVWIRRGTITQTGNGPKTAVFDPPELSTAFANIVTFADLIEGTRTVINGDFITTGTVDARVIQLDDQTIEAGDNGIRIKDLGVNTLQIANDAVIVPSSIELSQNPAHETSGDWVNMLAQASGIPGDYLEISWEGPNDRPSNILVLATVNFLAVNNGSDFYTLRLRTSMNNTGYKEVGISERAGLSTTATISAIFQPQPGVNYARIRLDWKANRGLNGNPSNSWYRGISSLSVFGVKR